MKPKQSELIETTQTLFKHAFKKQLHSIKEYPIVPIEGECIKTLQPNFNCNIRSADNFSMTTISTYACRNGKKDGDPICDKCGVLRFENCFVACMADGCGWGENSNKAAVNAVNTILDYLSNALFEVETTKDIADKLIESYIHAQNVIIESGVNNLHIGSTCVLTTCTLHIDHPKKGVIPVTFVISIGDCRLFVVDENESNIISLNGENRSSHKEIANCGGSIGASDGYYPCFDGSLLFVHKNKIGEKMVLVTDGFYDNIEDMNEYLLPLIQTSVTLADLMENFATKLIHDTEALRQQIDKSKKAFQHKGKLDHSSAIIYDVIETYSNDLVNSICPDVYAHLLPSRRRVLSEARFCKSSSFISVNQVPSQTKNSSTHSSLSNKSSIQYHSTSSISQISTLKPSGFLTMKPTDQKEDKETTEEDDSLSLSGFDKTASTSSPTVGRYFSDTPDDNCSPFSLVERKKSLKQYLFHSETVMKKREKINQQFEDQMEIQNELINVSNRRKDDNDIHDHHFSRNSVTPSVQFHKFFMDDDNE